MIELSPQATIVAAGQALGLYVYGLHRFRLDLLLGEASFYASERVTAIAHDQSLGVPRGYALALAISHFCAVEALRFTFVDSIDESAYLAQLALAQNQCRVVLHPLASNEALVALATGLRELAHALTWTWPHALMVLARMADERGILESADVEAILGILGETPSPQAGQDAARLSEP